MLKLISRIGAARTGPKVPFIAQNEASECGLACLAMIAAANGYNTDLISLRRRYGLSLKGSNLAQIIKIASQIGFAARPIRAEIDNLHELQLPAMLHWDLHHFVVLTKVSMTRTGNRYHILDPSFGEIRFGKAEMSERWTGVALELTKSSKGSPPPERVQMSIKQIFSVDRSIVQMISQLFVLSLISQAALLAPPFFLQTCIDVVLPTYDIRMLSTLAIGFAGLSAIELISNIMRAAVAASTTGSLTYKLTTNVMAHLVSLPLNWFEKRSVGDVVSRLSSTLPITQIIGNGITVTIIELLSAAVSLSLMLLYSARLTFVSLFSALIYLVLRISYLEVLRLKNISVISANANEQTNLIETIRGMSTIKAFGKETHRLLMWQRRKADAINAQIRLSKISSQFDSASATIRSFEQIAFGYLAIRMVIASEISLGMIFAFQGFRSYFGSSIVKIIDQFMSFRLLSVHTARLADAVTSPKETVGGSSTNLSNVDGEIRLANVAFTYGYGESPVLSGVNLRISAKSVVAIIGASGSGKTTLMKLMMGLIKPTTGGIYIDNHNLSGISLDSYRDYTGCVLQSDSLYTGTLGENISFFSPEYDYGRVRWAGRLSGIDDDIMRMPLGYDSLVGDMGSILSGGQRQRVMIARALYHDPAIIFIDEGTANLDNRSEGVVLSSIKSFNNATRILISHSHRVTAIADQIFLVAEGKVTDVTESVKKYALKEKSSDQQS